MTIPHYLVCKQHKEFVQVCIDGFSGPFLQSDPFLADFIVRHKNCSLSVMTGNEINNDEDFKELKNV